MPYYLISFFLLFVSVNTSYVEFKFLMKLIIISNTFFKQINPSFCLTKYNYFLMLTSFNNFLLNLVKQILKMFVLFIIALNAYNYLLNIFIDCNTSIIVLIFSNLYMHRSHFAIFFCQLLNFNWPCSTEHQGLSIRMRYV